MVEWNQHTCHTIQSMFLALDDYFPLWTHWQGLPIKLRDMVLTPPERSTQHTMDKMAVCGSEQINGITEQCKIKEEVKCKGVNNSRVNQQDTVEALKTSRLHAESECKQTSTISEDINSLHITGTQNDDKDCHRNSNSSVEKSVCHAVDPPGTVVYKWKSKVVSVRCVDGWVSFRKMVLKGHKPMSAQDFYNGFISKVPKEMSRFAGATIMENSSTDN